MTPHLLFAMEAPYECAPTEFTLPVEARVLLS